MSPLYTSVPLEISGKASKERKKEKNPYPCEVLALSTKIHTF